MRAIFRSVLIGVACAVALCGCSSMNNGMAMSSLQKGVQALNLTNDELAAYVKQSVAQMDAQNKVAPATNDYAKRLARLTSGIKTVGNTPLNFKVYITKDINAFACPDGSVRVFSGIMDIMNDEELLGIIGHEIGHVAREHSKQQFQQQLINSALLDLVGSTNATVAQLTHSQLAELGSSLLSAKYSRSQENEADDYGYDFLKSHGKNPYGMVEAFNKLQLLEQQGGQSAATSSYIQRMFSSHPETKDRIARMTNRCIKDGYIRK